MDGREGHAGGWANPQWISPPSPASPLEYRRKRPASEDWGGTRSRAVSPARSLCRRCAATRSHGPLPCGAGATREPREHVDTSTTERVSVLPDVPPVRDRVRPMLSR